MSAFIYDEQTEQGETFYRKVQWFSDPAKNEPLDLSGKTLEAILYNAQTGAPIGDFSISRDGCDVNEFYLAMPASDTAKLVSSPLNIYKYKIWRTEPDGITRSVGQKGNFQVLS